MTAGNRPFLFFLKHFLLLIAKLIDLVPPSFFRIDQGTKMEPIPGPRGLPIIGNLLDIALDDVSLIAFERLADTYGPIYELHMPGGRRIIVCSSAEYMAELTDEKRFVKEPPAALSRPGVKGLFNARTEDPDWGQAHRILVPAFGPLTMEGMFDGEHRIFLWLASTSLRLLDGIDLCRNERYRESTGPEMGSKRLGLPNPCNG